MDDELAERWKPDARPRAWLLPQSLDQARQLVREGVFAPLVFALIAFWTLVGSLGATNPADFLAPVAVLALSVVTGVALWWKQATWAAAIVVLMSLYFCLLGALPLLSGSFNLMLPVYLGMLVFAGRTVVATSRIPRLKSEAGAANPAAFD